MPIFVKSFTKFFVPVLIFALLQGCGREYTKSFSYIPKESLEDDGLYMIAKPEMQKTSNYGAIKFKAENANFDEGSLFVLQKRKEVFQAETMLYKSDNKRYYLNFGVHRREKMPAVGFRVEW